MIFYQIVYIWYLYEAHNSDVDFPAGQDSNKHDNIFSSFCCPIDFCLCHTESNPPIIVGVNPPIIVGVNPPIRRSSKSSKSYPTY